MTGTAQITRWMRKAEGASHISAVRQERRGVPDFQQREKDRCIWQISYVPCTAVFLSLRSGIPVCPDTDLTAREMISRSVRITDAEREVLADALR